VAVRWLYRAIEAITRVQQERMKFKKKTFPENTKGPSEKKTICIVRESNPGRVERAFLWQRPRLPLPQQCVGVPALSSVHSSLRDVGEDGWRRTEAETYEKGSIEPKLSLHQSERSSGRRMGSTNSDKRCRTSVNWGGRLNCLQWSQRPPCFADEGAG
jgi:hypothetical protein